MPHYIFVPSSNADDDFTGALEFTDWQVGITETVQGVRYDVYQLVQSDLAVEIAITLPMTGLGE
jgi:hypothetical protein